jgi:general secretion pathway protein A
MYAEYYGLREIPFGLTPDLNYIFKTESYLEVISTLKYGVEHNKGLVVLTGEVGTGKTTTLRSTIQQFGEEVLPVYMFNPFLTASEFFQQFVEGLGLGIPPSSSKPDVLAALGEFLALRHSQGLRTVLIIDEAHGLPSPVLEEIRLLLNYETNSEKLLQMILCGQPELQAILNRPNLRQLKQRISLRCEIKPLSPFEVSKYIRFRLKTAGAARVDLFDSEAAALIGRVSQGIPRVINNICDNALLYGYSASLEDITRDCIEEVVESLDLVPAESASAAHTEFTSRVRSVI